MCGIFGWITSRNADIPDAVYMKGIKELLLQSETRGKEASGICGINQDNVQVYKKCIRAKRLKHPKLATVPLFMTGDKHFCIMHRC